MALDLRKKFVSVRYLENKWTEYYQILYIYIDKIYVRIVTHYFSHTCTRVMALDLLRKFIDAQYLENKLTEFDQT